MRLELRGRIDRGDDLGGEDGELASFQQKVARLGYALRMEHLQQSGAAEAAPALFNAWMVDRDPANPSERAVDVRVVLSRDQLSDHLADWFWISHYRSRASGMITYP